MKDIEMAEDRDWKEAKPKWVVDAAKAEMAAMKRKLALRWPDDRKPEPLFWFGDYDRESGGVKAGEYFVQHGWEIKAVTIREKLADEAGWKTWCFKIRGEFSSQVERGAYFLTRKEAALFLLWKKCEGHAAELEKYWSQYEDAV